MRRAAVLLRGLPLLLVLSAVLACSVRMTDRSSFPEAAVRLKVAPYRQEPERCGPYALASVLGYFGKSVPPEKMSERLHSPGAGGTLTMDIYLEAARQGLDARQAAGTVRGLREELDGGFPAILLLRYPALASDRGHYVVVTGYSLKPEGFFLLWGDGQESWMTVGGLLRMWARSGNWMLSARPAPS